MCHSYLQQVTYVFEDESENEKDPFSVSSGEEEDAYIGSDSPSSSEEDEDYSRKSYCKRTRDSQAEVSENIFRRDHFAN